MGRALHTEGTANAKALRQECRWYAERAVKRFVWLEGRSEGEEVEDEVKEGSGEGEMI